MNGHDAERRHEVSAVDTTAASRLLHYATGLSRHAWSSLSERLHRIDGHGWATVRLEATFGRAVDPGRIPLDRLMAAKESAKSEVAAASDLEAQATAWLTYAAAVAAAAAYHGMRLSTMPTEAWIEVFAELSALTPEPWASVFEAAMAGWME